MYIYKNVIIFFVMGKNRKLNIYCLDNVYFEIYVSL